MSIAAASQHTTCPAVRADTAELFAHGVHLLVAITCGILFSQHREFLRNAWISLWPPETEVPRSSHNVAG